MKRTRGAIANIAASIRRRALTRMSASPASRANSSFSKLVVAAISTDAGRSLRAGSTITARAGSISRTLGMDHSSYEGARAIRTTVIGSNSTRPHLLGRKLLRHPEEPGGETAVDRQHDSSDPRGGIRDQEERGLGNVLRLADPAQGVPGSQLLHHVRVDRFALVPDRGVDGARSDAVGADVELAVADGGVLGEIDHPRLGRAVGLLAEAHQAIDGADVDD